MMFIKYIILQFYLYYNFNVSILELRESARKESYILRDKKKM